MPSAVLGQRADEVLPDWRAVGPTVPVALVPGPGSTDARTLPFVIEGREVWLSISGVAFEDGIVYAFRNLTEERALDELKGEFVATVSHELRTPLAAIYGSAQTLLREDIELDEDKRQRLLQVIAQESERLSRVAADILLANRIDSGRLQLETSPLDVTRLAEDVVEQMRSFFADRDDVTLELVAEEQGSFVAGDEDKLRQVLINLVDNAVKYSPEGGAVEVRVEPNGTSVRVSVTDEGLGIPHGEQQRIFGKFYRVDPQLSRGVGGTGLGLYICRELVRRMDGRLTVSSKEGHGSTFAIDLPLAPAPAAETTAPVVQHA
jgi:signal transduction histidine kinase